MKKRVWILSLLVMLCACSMAESPDSNTNVCGFSCEESDMGDYSSLEGVSHVFVDATYEEALQLLKNDAFTGIIYYGYPACPWCDEAVIEMNDAAKSLDLPIYYVNKKSEENLKHPELEKETAQYLNESFELMKNEEDEPHLFVPEVVVIKSGRIVDHRLGTFDEHDAKEEDLSESEKAQLEMLYKQMFRKIKNDH